MDLNPNSGHVPMDLDATPRANPTTNSDTDNQYQYQHQLVTADAESQGIAKENIRVQDFAYPNAAACDPFSFEAITNAPPLLPSERQDPNKPETPFSVFLKNYCTPSIPPQISPPELPVDPAVRLVPASILGPTGNTFQSEPSAGFYKEAARQRSASTTTKEGELISQGMDKRLPSSFQQLEKVGHADCPPLSVTDIEYGSWERAHMQR